MKTIADVTEQLSEQNKIQLEQTQILVQTSDGITSMKGSLLALVNSMKTDKMRDLEAERENNAAKRVQKTNVSTTKKDKDDTGILGGLGDIFKKGGIFKLGQELLKALPGFLLGRALPAFLAKMFADEIANFVESQTGSKTLGDAIYRGLNLGALGLLISKRFGAIGFVAGALLDESNREKLNVLGDKLGEFGDNIAKLFGTDGLPSFTEAMTFVTETLGKAIDFLISGVALINLAMKDNKTEEEIAQMETELDNMGDTIGSFALAVGGLGLMFKRVRGLIGRMILGITKITTAGATALPAASAATAGAAALSRTDMIKELTKMSDKQLAKQGLERTAGGKGIQRLGGGIASDAEMKRTLDLKGASKFPRLGKFLRFGPIAALLAAYDIYSVITSPGSVQDKVAALGGILGGVLGAGGGAMLGGAMGSVFPGPGTLIGGILGGGIGYFAGDSVGKGLAQYLLGQKVDAMPFDTLNDMLNGTGDGFGQGSVNIPADMTMADVDAMAMGAKATVANRVQRAFTPTQGSTLQSETDRLVANNTPAAANIVDASDKSVSVTNNQGMTVTGPIQTPHNRANVYVSYAGIRG